MQEDTIEIDLSGLLNKINMKRANDLPDNMNERGILAMSNSKKDLTFERYTGFTEMSETAFQKANRDFAKLFSSAGFTKERSNYYSGSIIRSLRNGLPQDGSIPEVLNFTYSMSEKSGYVIDRFNMIDREGIGKGSYINGAAKGMKTISALYYRELRISINMRTGKIKIDRKQIKTIEMKSTVLVRGLNDKEARSILDKAIDYLKTEARGTEGPQNSIQPDLNSRQTAGTDTIGNGSDTYMSKLLIDLKNILENIRENKGYTKDLFESIIDIREILIEKNYANDDILKLTMDLLIPLGSVENGNFRNPGREKEDLALQDIKKVDISV